MACIMKYFFYFIFFDRGSLPYIYTFFYAQYFFCQKKFNKIKKKPSLFFLFFKRLFQRILSHSFGLKEYSNKVVENLLRSDLPVGASKGGQTHV